MAKKANASGHDPKAPSTNVGRHRSGREGRVKASAGWDCYSFLVTFALMKEQSSLNALSPPSTGRISKLLSSSSSS